MKGVIFIVIFLIACSTTSDVIQSNTCPTPKIANESNLPFDEEDKEVMEKVIALNRCFAHYEGLPCLKTFHKRGKAAYYVECGK
jgi:hypothetical protein